MTDSSDERDPLAAWPAFAEAVLVRLEAGRDAYGDRSFSAEPSVLIEELRQECRDLAGWAYILDCRLLRMLEALNAPSTTGDPESCSATEDARRAL